MEWHSPIASGLVSGHNLFKALLMNIFSKIKSFFASMFSSSSSPKSTGSLPWPTNLILGSAAWYLYGWDHSDISEAKKPEVLATCKVILSHKDEYVKIESVTQVPWQMIACLHYRESSLDFKAALANGDEIIGTGKLTHNVPAGRGPFATFYDSAVDALHYDGFAGKNDWNIQNILTRCERYNGLGYLKYHQATPSPYIWSGTTLYSKGKYSGDGVFDPNLIDKQLGVAVLLKGLQSLGEFNA